VLDYEKGESNLMTKILKHAGVEYDLDLLVTIKGQGTTIKSNSEECIADTSTIVSADIQKPLVVKQGNKFLILVDTAHPRSERSFQVTLISKHILKKAKIEVKPIDSPVGRVISQGGFKAGSPWKLVSESARQEFMR
jgi:hypothetical protein